jgi:hypothetical protein
MLEKTERESRKDNPEKLAILDTHDTGRRKQNKKHNTTHKTNNMC